MAVCSYLFWFTLVCRADVLCRILFMMFEFTSYYVYVLVCSILLYPITVEMFQHRISALSKKSVIIVTCSLTNVREERKMKFCRTLCCYYWYCCCCCCGDICCYESFSHFTSKYGRCVLLNSISCSLHTVAKNAYAIQNNLSYTLAPRCIFQEQKNNNNNNTIQYRTQAEIIIHWILKQA